MPINIPHQQFIKELSKLGGLSSQQARKLSGSAITSKFSYGQIKDQQALKKHVASFLENASKQGVKLPGSVTRQTLEKHFERIGAEAATEDSPEPSSQKQGLLSGVKAALGVKPGLAHKNFSAVEYLQKIHGQNAEGDKNSPSQPNRAVTSVSALERESSEPNAPDIG